MSVWSPPHPPHYFCSPPRTHQNYLYVGKGVWVCLNKGFRITVGTPYFPFNPHCLLRLVEFLVERLTEHRKFSPLYSSFIKKVRHINVHRYQTSFSRLNNGPFCESSVKTASDRRLWKFRSTLRSTLPTLCVFCEKFSLYEWWPSG